MALAYSPAADDKPASSASLSSEGSGSSTTSNRSGQQHRRSSPAAAVDAGKLRRVLRAIHCLQKERGASCALCVCLNGRDRDAALVEKARTATDRALAEVHSTESADEEENRLVNLTLSKIRKLLDHRQDALLGEGGGGLKAPSARRLLVSFSTLISAVLHTFVIRHTVAVHHSRQQHPPRHVHHHRRGHHGKKKGCREEIEPSSPCSMPRVRSVSDLAHDACARKDSRAAAAGRGNGNSKPSQRRHTSDMDAVVSNLGSIVVVQDHPKLNLQLNSSNKNDGDNGDQKNKHGQQHPLLLPRLESGVSLDGSSDTTPVAGSGDNNSDGGSLKIDDDNTGVSIEDDDLSGRGQSAAKEQSSRYRQVNLLRLLDIFVRFKESNGVERASFTSILVSNDDGDSGANAGSASAADDARMLLNDVALEVENQRRLLEELAVIPPGSMRNLVLELITMSPEMSQLQNLVLGGLSLDGLREQYDSEKIWDVMTVYIDKLHSLELLIVEEIEFCSPPPPPLVAMGGGSKRGGDPADEILPKLFNEAFGAQASAEDLLRSIQSMPPAEVKKRMLSCLKKDPSVHIEEKYSKKGVDELLKELCNAPASKEWEIDIYELRFLKRIGQGSAGTTYAADWAGLKVAVKVASITEMGLEGWRTEVQALQKLHHPNIIRLLGSVYHAHPLTFCLVLEYCDGGDLSSALCKVTPRNFFYHVSLSIAKGLSYLHNRSIIHRDVKPSNILIQGDLSTNKYQVKVTDFGVATDLDSVRDRTAETGTYRWMAPEVIRHEKYSQTADVYSYAILVWQLVTREEPFGDRGQIEAAVAVSMEGARPPLPAATPGAIAKLIEQCWGEDPESRPSFVEVADTLTDVFDTTLRDEEKVWLDSPLGHSVYREGANTKAPKPPESGGELKIPKPLGADGERRKDGAAAGENHQHKDDRNKKKKNRLRTLFARKSSYF